MVDSISENVRVKNHPRSVHFVFRLLKKFIVIALLLMVMPPNEISYKTYGYVSFERYQHPPQKSIALVCI